MPAAVLKSAIKQYCSAALGGGAVKFFGGEPLLRFGLVRTGIGMLEAAGYRGRAEVGTNGLLLDAAKLRYFSARPWVQVNINSSVSVSRRFAALPNLIWNLLLPERDPLSSLGVLKRVIAASRGRPPRVNVLPAYYREWTPAALAKLARALRHIRELADSGAVVIENASREGPVPLFNPGTTVDTDGRCYHSNLVLAARDPGQAAQMLAGGLEALGAGSGRRPDYSGMAKKLFGAKAVAGGMAADRLAERILLG
ncbi:MAG: hypothetical protein M0011_11940 [Elusimicrobia bacterium]|nr:hypothetical protein [Elusimicrobiota bacterium]